MKKFILIALMSIITVQAFGQKLYDDGVINRLSKDEDGYKVSIGGTKLITYRSDYITQIVSIEVNDGIVTKIHYTDYSGLFSSNRYCTSDKTAIMTYFEFDKGLRNLAENNQTTAVYRTQYYEYRISNKGVIVELLNKK